MASHRIAKRRGRKPRYKKKCPQVQSPFELGRPKDPEPSGMAQGEVSLETANHQLAAKGALGDSTQPPLARRRLAYPSATAVDHRSQRQNLVTSMVMICVPDLDASPLKYFCPICFVLVFEECVRYRECLELHLAA